MGPHMAFSSFWACQTSQLPYSQWQQTPSQFFPPNTASKYCLSLASLQITYYGQSSRNKAPKQKQPPMTTPQKSQLCFCWISFHVGDVPDLFTITRDCYLFLFNEMTKQQICICKSRCCNRFDYSWPKACKKGLAATAVSEALVLWWSVKTLPSVEMCSKWLSELKTDPQTFPPLFAYEVKF